MDFETVGLGGSTFLTSSCTSLGGVFFSSTLGFGVVFVSFFTTGTEGSFWVATFGVCIATAFGVDLGACPGVPYGNGGLSLRDISASRTCLTRQKNDLNEDRYFSECLTKRSEVGHRHS